MVINLNISLASPNLTDEGSKKGFAHRHSEAGHRKP